MSEYVKCGTNAIMRGWKPGMPAMGDLSPATKTYLGLGLVGYALYAMFFAKKGR